MSYLEIWQDRIAKGQTNKWAAMLWMIKQGMRPMKAWYLFNGADYVE